MSKVVVKCENLCKDYTLYYGDIDRFKSLIFPNKKNRVFSALKNINLEFTEGEIVGLIGLNGSGKSTLSNIIAGITYPTSGTVKTEGEISMLAAQAGMQSYLTGMENIEYKCLLLGFDKNQINKIREDIIEFADIGIYIDQPVKTYSSGMLSRLGFAISISINPDILIVDEALAVGDSSFTDKCLNKMDEYKRNGKTIIFVSHAINQMVGFCDRVIWLNKGEVIGQGKPEDMVDAYSLFAREIKVMTPKERENYSPNFDSFFKK